MHRSRPPARSPRTRRRSGRVGLRTSRARLVAGRRGRASAPSLREAGARCKVTGGKGGRPMSSILIALLVPIVLATIVFAIVLTRAAIKGRARPSLETLGLGAIVCFFDTLGIGSFAPSTAWLKFRKL